MNTHISIVGLVDLLRVVIYKELPVEEKSMDFVRKIKDPYHYKIGDVKITAQFTQSAPKLTRNVQRLNA
jgi:hypothetical protein